MTRLALRRGSVAHHCTGILLLLLCVLPVAAAAGSQPPLRIAGKVASADRGLGGFAVELLATRSPPHAYAQRLGRAFTGDAGRFHIRYEVPVDPNAVLYLVARRGPVALASALVASPNPMATARPAARPTSVVLNERTTVAVGFALAQFLKRGNVAGNVVGVRNGGAMVGDLVEVQSGGIAPVLGLRPNGAQTSTLATFNALANLVQGCVALPRDCAALLQAAPGSRGKAAPDTLQAIVNIARNPWRNVEAIYSLTAEGPQDYQPALTAAPDAWTLALRFVGNGRLNGPGAFAIDGEGNAWVAANYTPGGPDANVCAADQVFKFTPTGQTFPGSPYRGGGLSGVGFGITLDPKGRVWLGNFGFQSPVCAQSRKAAAHDSVSLFRADGKPLSPRKRGFTAGNLSWPMGTVSDQQGNIWIASCGNDSVTLYPEGNPLRARHFGRKLLGLRKPFDVAIGSQRRAWVTGNASGSIAIIGTDGIQRIAHRSFDRPMGIASDSRGNMWVANSAVVDVPCPDGGPALDGRTGGSIALIAPDGTVSERGPFQGGGLTIPWGVAVDGNDQVWVANFGTGRGKVGPALVRLSQFCGTRPETCPPGKRTGDPISPAAGYTSDGLTRVTAVAIDPTGNVWATNNWKLDPKLNNPGASSIMIFLGLAAPLATPLIGPPVPAG